MTDFDGGPVKLSVVIPTYNRRAQLHRVLVALAAQTATRFEVIVIADGSTDGTAEYLNSRQVPLGIKVVLQSNAGPAAARNKGVLCARGEIVLFLDDDVVPAHDLVARHIAAQESALHESVVIGPMLDPTGFKMSPWVAWEQHQLQKQYVALISHDYEPTFRQFYTGNASVPRDALIRAGLFDTGLRRAEDVELAFRLHQLGLGFTFEPEAKGYHYAVRSFDSWLNNAREYGLNDIGFLKLGQQWLNGALKGEFASRRPLVRVLAVHVSTRPRIRSVATRLLSRLAMKFVVQPVQRQVLSVLFSVSYYGGIYDALGSRLSFLEMMR